MNLRTKAPLIIIPIVLLTAGLSAYSSYKSSIDLIDKAKNQELQTTATVIESSIASNANKAAARASMIVSLPSIQEAFRRLSREDLIKRLVPAFLEQREQYGVREAQFTTSPAISFLRLYDVENGHGEDLSSFRDMIVTADKTQTLQKGIEVGRRGLSIRGVAPIRDDKGPMGCLEVGMDFNTVLQQVRATTGFEAGVFIDDGLMAKVATMIPRPDDERIIGGYQAVSATNWQALRALVTPQLVTNESHTVKPALIAKGGTDFGVVAVPVVDYKQTPIGSIIALRNFEDYQVQANWALVLACAVAFLQAVLIIGTLLVVINAMLLGPMEGIADNIKQLAKREAANKLDVLTKSDDEIGNMARNLEALNGVVQKTVSRR